MPQGDRRKPGAEVRRAAAIVVLLVVVGWTLIMFRRYEAVRKAHSGSSLSPLALAAGEMGVLIEYAIPLCLLVLAVVIVCTVDRAQGLGRDGALPAGDGAGRMPR